MNSFTPHVSAGRSIALLGLAFLTLAQIASAQATLTRLFVGKPNLVLGPTSVDGSTWLATSKSGTTVSLLRAKNVAVSTVTSRTGPITPKEISNNGDTFTYQTDTYSYFTYKSGVIQAFTIPGGGLGNLYVAGAMSDDGTAILGTKIIPFSGGTKSYYIRNGVALEINGLDWNKLHLTHISGDGLTAFGRPLAGSYTNQTFFWSQAEGTMSMYNIFSDREIFLGPSTTGNFSVIRQDILDYDYYWLRGVDGGTAQFGLPKARAVAMSLDGRVVTGYSGTKTWRWELGDSGWQSATIEQLNFNGWVLNRPTAISANGKYIAGRGISISTDPAQDSAGYIHSKESGLRNLKVLLGQKGASTSNWERLVVVRVAENSQELVLLGTGLYLGVTTPFRATLPKTW